MRFEDKKEITDKKIIEKEEKRVIERLISDLLFEAELKNKKFINNFSTLQKLKKVVEGSVEVFWFSYKMKLSIENVYLGVLEELF